MPDNTLDCSGLICPEPVIRARQAIAGMQPGQNLDVIATDPLAELDLTVFCQQTGHELVDCETRDGRVVIRIRVSPARRPDAG